MTLHLRPLRMAHGTNQWACVILPDLVWIGRRCEAVAGKTIGHQNKLRVTLTTLTTLYLFSLKKVVLLVGLNEEQTMKTLLMFLSVAILSGWGGGLVTQQKIVEQIKTLKEEVKLLKQENQIFRKNSQ